MIRHFTIAGKLTSISIRKGQFVGVLLRNHLDTMLVLYALQMIGAAAVILNNRLTDEEIAWQMDDSKSAILLTEEAFNQTIIALQEKEPAYPIFTKEGLLARDSAEPVILEQYHLDDTCSIMYTSGTTGFPKGVIQTYGNHWWSAIGSALNLGLTENDSWLCSLPLFHISGYSILTRSQVYGMTVVLHDSFNVEKVIQDIKQHKITLMSVVPTVLNRIVKGLKGEQVPSHFRCALLGGGPASMTLLESCAKSGIPVFQSYGMTETSSQIVTLSPEDCLEKIGSAGKPLFPAELKIIDADGIEQRPRGEGEIIVKGPNVTKGYLFREKATAEKIKNGWLHTGDIGYVDEEGFLYVLDRRADLIISGGENIYPAEIEGILLSHREVADAGVIGVKDENWGQVPAAFIVVEKGSKLKSEELITFCQQKLAKFKVPKKIIFIDRLPRNAAKKLLRRNLREQFERGNPHD